MAEVKEPYGKFYGGRRHGSYTYYGMGGQQVVFDYQHPLPRELSADELIALKPQTKSWAYYPLGKLF
jgi:hypothetical protein